MITQSELKEILHYDPETGIFTWLKAKKSVIGCRAGFYSNLGYRQIRIKGKYFYEQRLAFVYMENYTIFKKEVDHINRNKGDNRWINLRLVTRNQNLANANIRFDNTSGIKGVNRYLKDNRWQARIGVNGKRIHLGYFDNKEEAAAAYQQAAIRYYGKYTTEYQGLG